MEAIPFSESSTRPDLIIDEKPIDVMIWNVQPDAHFARALMAHFASMRRSEGISVKDFSLDIAAGATSAQSIARLARAHVRIVLVSSDFITALMEDQLTIDASDAVITARDRMHLDGGDYRIIPTVVRSVNQEAYAKDPLLGKIQALPRNGRPVHAWKSHDKAWAVTVSEVRSVLISLGRLNPAESRW